MSLVALGSRIRNARDLPARLAYRLSNVGPIAHKLGARYQRALAVHRSRLPNLSRDSAAIVGGLRRDGVHVTTLAALGLPQADGVLATARRLATDFAETARAEVRAGREFVIVPPATVAAHPELFRLGLDDRLLDIAEAYLGLPAAYDGVQVIYTVADGRAVSTRQWHRDWEDRRMVKLAIYCSDVGGDDGPLQVLARTEHDQTDATGFRYKSVGSPVMAQLFGEQFDRDVVTCTGPAGTAVFTDTGRYYHRGQPAVRHDRQAIFFTYFAQVPRHPFLCERSGMTRRQIATLVDGLPPRQRTAALWWRRLPVPLRLIPPHRL